MIQVTTMSGDIDRWTSTEHSVILVDDGSLHIIGKSTGAPVVIYPAGTWTGYLTQTP